MDVVSAFVVVGALLEHMLITDQFCLIFSIFCLQS